MADDDDGAGGVVDDVVTHTAQHRPPYLAHAPGADDDHRRLLLRRRRDDHLTRLRASLRAQCHVRHLPEGHGERGKVIKQSTMNNDIMKVILGIIL